MVRGFGLDLAKENYFDLLVIGFTFNLALKRQPGDKGFLTTWDFRPTTFLNFSMGVLPDNCQSPVKLEETIR